MGVIIGMDPHKRSATIEVTGERGGVLAVARYGTDKAGYAQMLRAGRKFDERIWAIEGCNGAGRHIAHRLVADGETVMDVPAKLSAQIRVFATGNGRKTDPVDAHSAALAALRSPNLVILEVDPDLVVLGLLADRRGELGRARTQTINRIHRLLPGLLPGGAKQFLSAAQARALIAATRPRGIVGKTRRRLAAELITELEGIDRKIRTCQKEIQALVEAQGSTLLQLHGIGPPVQPGCWPTSATSTGSPAGTTSHPGTAPPPWTPHPASSNATGSPAPATGGSTGHCTSWPSSSCATRPKDAPATTPGKPPGRPRWKPCAASNDACPMSPAGRCSATRTPPGRRAREGTRGRLFNPA
jgi:transposase